MSEPELHVLADPASAVAELLADAAKDGVAIVLTGGSSVEAVYEQAARLEPDWSAASVWWSDERCVPPEDPRSNYGLAKRALLDRVEHPPRVHRMRGELAPAEAADAYEVELGSTGAGLMLLGLGPDAHVASLFPGSPQLAERNRLVTWGHAGLEPFVDRVTLTLPALLTAQRIVFLVTGADKAEAVERAFRGPITEDAPASLLRAGEMPISVFLDAAAAGSG